MDASLAEPGAVLGGGLADFLELNLGHREILGDRKAQLPAEQTGHDIVVAHALIFVVFDGVDAEPAGDQRVEDRVDELQRQRAEVANIRRAEVLDRFECLA